MIGQLVSYPKFQGGKIYRVEVSKNFDISEFHCRCNKCGITFLNTYLVGFLQHVRNVLGEPIKITSGYRCPYWNRRIKGSVNSMHQYGLAADARTVSRQNVESIATIALADEFIGGFGRYEINGKLSRVHVDFRDRIEGNGPVTWTKEFGGDPPKKEK